MPKFMLLLYSDPAGFARLSPEQAQTAMQKYMDWRTKPFVVDSNRLGLDTGKVIKVNGAQPHATDGPFSETKEHLGGYYTIEAKDYDDAVRIAMEHPHVELRAGTVEIRQLWAG